MMNYNEEMKKIIVSLDYVPTLLLHSCCAPCSSHVISLLSNFFKITIIYYNPNIEPLEEYEKRKHEQKKLLKVLKTKYKVNFLDCDYSHDDFVCIAKGHEQDKEGGSRCSLCISNRIGFTALKAKENNFDYFTTTLSVSPHKNAILINNLMKKYSQKFQIKFLPSDFKKENGYLNSINLSKKYNLYRQNYCGCLFSKNN